MSNEDIHTHESIEIQHVDQLMIRVLNFCINNGVGISWYCLKQVEGCVELKCRYERAENTNSSSIVRLMKEVGELKQTAPTLTSATEGVRSEVS